MSDSGWEQQPVLRAYRRLLARPMADPAGVVVIEDTGLPKKGRCTTPAPRGDDPLALRLFPA